MSNQLNETNQPTQTSETNLLSNLDTTIKNTIKNALPINNHSVIKKIILKVKDELAFQKFIEHINSSNEEEVNDAYEGAIVFPPKIN